MNNIDQIAQQFIEGKWVHDKKNNTLKKAFASNQELIQLNLINEDGYLELALKDAIVHFLGEGVLHNAQGHFGDADIFSGDILDDITLYNIELHHITQNNLDALLKIPRVVIKAE